MCSPSVMEALGVAAFVFSVLVFILLLGLVLVSVFQKFFTKATTSPTSRGKHINTFLCCFFNSVSFLFYFFVYLPFLCAFAIIINMFLFLTEFYCYFLIVLLIVSMLWFSLLFVLHFWYIYIYIFFIACHL